MKLNKYIGLAAMAVAFSACQQDMLEGENMQNGIYTLSGNMAGGAAMSRAQIVLGNTDASAGEKFFWNEGDSFTVYQGENDNYTEHVFTIKDYTEEGEGDKKTASFVTNNPVSPGEIIAVYPSGMEMDYDQEIMKVGMDFQTELDFGQGTVEAVWKDYFRNNMVMKAKATLTEGGNNTLSFEHLTSLARITYNNQSGKDQNVTEIIFGGDQTFGFSKTVWFKYDIIGGNSSNGYRINYKNLTVKDGESFDFYILFGPNDFREGDMHIHIHTAQTDVNREPLKLPTATIAAANNNATKFEAGKRYWFKVTETSSELVWSKDFSSDVVTIKNAELSQALYGVLGADKVSLNSDNYAVMNKADVEAVTALNFNNKGYTITSLAGIENFVNLDDLRCNSVGLVSCDLSKNTALKLLMLTGNNFQSLDLSSNVNLEVLYLEGCGNLTSVKLDNCSKLGFVTLYYSHSLTSFDVPNKAALYSLNYGNTQLQFNLSEYTGLTTLKCAGVGLESLDLSTLTKIKTLWCDHNSIEVLDVASLENLEDLRCGSQNNDIVLQLKLTAAQKEKWNSTWSTNSNNTNVELYETITIKNTELSTALQAVLGASNVKLDDNGYAVMTKEFVESVTTLDFGYRKYTITSLSGIESFNNLQSLRCNNTGLVECDLSKNKALRTVNLGYQKFSKFILNEMENLESIDLAFSQWNLTDVNLNNNVNLGRISLASCGKLTNLNIEGCNNIFDLDLRHTQISTLAIPNPSRVTWLGCAETLQIDWDKFTNLRTLWMWGMTDSYLESIPNTIKQNLTDFHCGQGTLSNLDLNDFPKLMSLACFDNLLTSLDTSKNPNLTELDCSGNRLTALDLTANTLLKDLFCGNQTDENGNNVTLKLKLSDMVLDLWNNEWSTYPENLNVELVTAPSVETGSGNTGGSDFTIEGIY